tara:strand:+ start:353 stop:577 length:225 start_codon:yes stop_codon:yes gene_type:complete
MKINGGISLGNVIVIVTLIASVAVAWGSMSSIISEVKEDVEKKADKELVDYKFTVILSEIAEIKDMLKQTKRRK